MKKNHYYIKCQCADYFCKEVGANKREAIKRGKEVALEQKTTCTLMKCVEKEGKLIPPVEYIALLEFPYYLRNCQLDTSDITVVLF